LFASCGTVGALGHPRPEDLLADILDLDRAGLVREMGERGFHRDEPVQEVLLIVLEAEVEHVRLTARRDVAGHLQGHRRLAGPLGATDEQELAGRRPVPIVLSSGVNPSGTGWYSPMLPAGDLVVQVDEHVERRARRHAAGVRVETPGPRLRGVRVGGFSAHAVRYLPGVTVTSHRSTRTGRGHPPRPSSSDQPRSSRALCSARPTPRRPYGWPALVVARSIDSFGAWALSSGGVNPRRTTGQTRGSTRSWRRPGSSPLADVQRRLGRTWPRAPARPPASPDGRCGVRLGRPPPRYRTVVRTPRAARSPRRTRANPRRSVRVLVRDEPAAHLGVGVGRDDRLGCPRPGSRPRSRSRPGSVARPAARGSCSRPRRRAPAGRSSPVRLLVERAAAAIACAVRVGQGTTSS
jgi:hypothetical protein